MNGNKKGPENRGSKTGRAMGFCAGYDQPGRLNRPEEKKENIEFGLRQGNGLRQGRGFGMGQGRGFGQGRGMAMGRGFRPGRGFNNPVEEESDK